MSCIAYGATKMTHRDRPEMIKRARYLRAVAAQYGITLISPILKEDVPNIPGPLENNSRDVLKGHWDDDKHIIRRIAHMVVIDGAQMKSFGVEREYGLNRWNLWKLTFLLVDKKELSVADFEDDFIHTDPHVLFSYIRDNFLTRRQRIVWRIKMLMRCLPKRLLDEVYAWR
jgi:hypothetical protein